MEVKDIGKFFRIFDLAFFIPGAALGASLLFLYFPANQIEAVLTQVAKIELAAGLGVAVGTVVATYILGVACHAVGRWLLPIVPAPCPEKGDPPVPWYQNLPESHLIDTTLYLWVLASTSLNLAAACLIVWVLSLFREPPDFRWSTVAVTTFGFLAFLYGYRDFRQGYRGFAAQIKPAPTPPPSA